jgi:predicted DNA-binding transcriptional regulator AlpA
MATASRPVEQAAVVDGRSKFEEGAMMTAKNEGSPPQLAGLDGFVLRREVEQLTGYSPRTLARKIAAGTFPPPEVPGGNGEPSRWRYSTVQRALDAMTGR